METPQSTPTLREATPLEAVSFLESELSTVSPSTEEHSTRSTSPQLLSSSVIQRSRTSFVWKHMPGPVNTIYARGEYTGVVNTVPRSIGSQVEQDILPYISKLLMIFTI